MKRESGFYWVRNDDKWSVAEWCEDVWFGIGSEETLRDTLFDEIGHRISPNSSYTSDLQAPSPCGNTLEVVAGAEEIQKEIAAAVEAESNSRITK